MKPPSHHPSATAELLRSLLDSIPKTQHFKSKWSLISAKISHLESHLPNLPHNSLSNELFIPLEKTLSHALSVAVACHAPSLPAGKLKTQNDVDSVSAKLDSLVRDCEVLTQNDVVSDSSSNTIVSKNESARAESRNLITRLQIGSTESRNSALDSLLGLLQEDDKNVLTAVAQGVVPVLVRLLDSSSSSEIKEKTVSAIARASAVDSSKQALTSEGLVLLNDLLRVVESGSGYAKEKACIALGVLSNSKENARAIGSRGGIYSILEICQSGTPSSQAVAAGVLRTLSKFDDVRDIFIEENAVGILLVLASSGTALAQEHAIGCLCNLVKEDVNLKVVVVKRGGIEIVKSYWDSAADVKTLEVAVELLRSLALNDRIVELLASHGFLCRIVGVLSCGVLGVRVAAAKAVCDLGFSVKAKKEFGECGCIPPLIAMLDGKATQEREAAVKALSVVLGYAGNRKIFRKEERGILSVVQLLDPLVQNLDKRYPISVLSSLVNSKKCCKQMAAAGASLHLPKLVEMDVEGAKKLLDTIGRGKLWGVFSKP